MVNFMWCILPQLKKFLIYKHDMHINFILMHEEQASGTGNDGSERRCKMIQGGDSELTEHRKLLARGHLCQGPVDQVWRP